VPVLYPSEEERRESFVEEYVDTDEFRYYVEDAEVRNAILRHRMNTVKESKVAWVCAVLM